MGDIPIEHLWIYFNKKKILCEIDHCSNLYNLSQRAFLGIFRPTALEFVKPNQNV